jgi:hypothetical protein
LVCKYYIDESGNSGDLVGRSRDLNFGGQPIFSLACVGVNDYKKLEDFLSCLKADYELGEGELKSGDVYFHNPGVFLDLARFMSEEGMPLLVEIVDKKYCIAASIVSHHIMPPYFMPDESDGKAQFIRNGLADYLTFNLNDDVFNSFFMACEEPSENSLLASMSSLRSFFESKRDECDFSDITVKMINETIDDYEIIKSEEGENRAVERFIPIPDLTENGLKIKILPHVHSIFNLMARVNKYHFGSVGEVRLIHDCQDEFGYILRKSKEHLESAVISDNLPPIVNADFCFTEKIGLEFVDSAECIGVQVADLLAGFFNRYVNGLLYKNVNIEEVYHLIFFEFRKSFKNGSPLGVNFVLPDSKRQIIFRKFNF